MPVNTAPVSEIPKILDSSKRLIDVRTPSEYRSEHVKGAELLPLDQLNGDDFCQAHGTEAPVYILCQSGGRATKAAEQLTQAGHQNAIVIEGGTLAAIKAGIPTEKGKQSISIERQVRIAAGSLVFLGTLGGSFLHPALFIIPAFIGAGLTFSGITDTCGMGLMLGKCPWNR
jgi:rhodanese-related sulfurtransferase